MEIRAFSSPTASVGASSGGRPDAPNLANQSNASVKPATANTTEAAVRQPSRSTEIEQTKHAVEDIERMMKLFSRSVQFTYDNEEKRTIMRVVDQDTEEIIRQVPTQEALEIARAMARVHDMLLTKGSKTSQG